VREENLDPIARPLQSHAELLRRLALAGAGFEESGRSVPENARCELQRGGVGAPLLFDDAREVETCHGEVVATFCEGFPVKTWSCAAGSRLHQFPETLAKERHGVYLPREVYPGLAAAAEHPQSNNPGRRGASGGDVHESISFELAARRELQGDPRSGSAGGPSLVINELLEDVDELVDSVFQLKHARGSKLRFSQYAVDRRFLGSDGVEVGEDGLLEIPPISQELDGRAWMGRIGGLREEGEVKQAVGREVAVQVVPERRPQKMNQRVEAVGKPCAVAGGVV